MEELLEELNPAFRFSDPRTSVWQNILSYLETKRKLGQTRRMRVRVYWHLLQRWLKNRKRFWSRTLPFEQKLEVVSSLGRKYNDLCPGGAYDPKGGNLEIGERLKGRRITICRDSEAALRAFRSSLITSKIVQERRSRLNSVSRFNTVELFWVEGNEISDALTKEGSITPMPGPESIGLSVALTNAAIKTGIKLPIMAGG